MQQRPLFLNQDMANIPESKKQSVSFDKALGQPKGLPPTFPPFPAAPHGVNIIPFEDFTPYGYKRLTTETGEEIEVDALGGLPTVKVLSDEEVIQRNKDRKRRRNAGQSADATGRIVPWWEEWEEGENSRTMSEPIELGKSLIDRVHQATDDFRVGRTWPPIALGVRTLWDHFRLYIGLLSSLPIYRKVKKSKGATDMSYEGGGASDNDDAPKAKQINLNIIQDPLEQIAHPGKQLEPNEGEADIMACLLETFLEDMEKSIKVFMSSYMRDRGLIWSERNLFTAPTVLHFFLRFMQRNGVFAGFETHTENLNRAVAVAELAIKELPSTARVARVLPGMFDAACKECWGYKGSLSMYISATLDSEDECTTDTPASSAVGAFEEALKADNAEIVSSDVVLDSLVAKEVLDDTFGADDGVNVSPPPVDDPWAAAITAGQNTTASWTDVKVDSLFTFLGPTQLPLTHTTGVVEFSTRKVKEIILPEAISSIPDAPSTAVEQALGSRFARIVMEPWVRTPTDELLDIVRPVITSSSRGAVIKDPFADDIDVSDTHSPSDAYNPCRDDLTILIEPTSVDCFHVGLGLCGTWVQMARCEDVESSVTATDQDTPHVSKHPRDCFWYLEDVVSIFPSFYTESEVEIDLGQTSDNDDL
ncbi:hypothetical protein DEU56DRAFT_821869 [Suillus clintonianus]|uniref:uncharacterized protein n=1 Tax=Suillus clintonianus TaxID=1904413 RepID=UPI001B88403F|nr:uncharacterized protein DEU56DRAFT_821869 [Suillus clintonianus]KAG2126825.1 hypothetical protein DEU56DRAFT_821869 [Suillus clintonianus]